MGRPAAERESRVGEREMRTADVPEYRRTRETRWEAGGTTLQAKILPDDR